MSVDFNVESDTFDHDPVWEAAPGINVNNANGGLLLEVLGLPTDPWNLPMNFDYPTGYDFLGRVLLALGVAPQDEGRPAAVDPDSPRWIESARRSDYTQDRLGELRTLAEYAIAHNRRVTWG